MSDARTAPRQTGRWRRVLAYGFLALASVLAIALGAAMYLLGQMGVSIADIPLQEPGSVAFKDRERLNILCLGVDYNHDSKAQLYTKWVRSDTIFVVSIDRKAETLNMVSIPRDTRVEIPGYGYDKINAAFATMETGNLQLTRQTVQKFLGIPIDHTVVIKPYAAESLVDAIGGVTVKIDRDMDYDDNWGDLHIHLKKGQQRLSGKQAVGFVRFRADEEGDRGRIRRQQQFLSAMLSELKSFKTLTHANGIARAARDNIQTTLSFAELVDLARLYHGFDRHRMKTAKIDGEDAFYGGAACIEPDEAQKRRIVATLLRGGSPAPADVRLEILNASEVAGAARRLADMLAARGFNVVRVASAPTEDRTCVMDHAGDPSVSKVVTGVLGPLKVVADRQPDAEADLTIVLGRDWREKDRPN